MALPHQTVLWKLSSLVPGVSSSADGMKSYLKAKAKKLSPQELYVSLQIDEVYVKPSMTYLNGQTFGMATNTTDLATSVQVFMISGVFCGLRDVVLI